jgi:hypothetical protein
MRAPLAALFVTAASCAVAPVCADDSVGAGRSVLKKYGEAVVTVQLVVNYNVSAGGNARQNESKTEAIGTVIDPGGLTVISLSSMDPSAILKVRARAMQQDLKIDSEVKDAKILLADGGEVAAEIVLRDKDLDVAFLRPTAKPTKPFVAIDLRHTDTPQVLDVVICLNRLGKVASRVVAVSLESISALVERPRRFFVLEPGGSSGVGSPVFAQSGATLGIILIRNAATEGEANFASIFSGASSLGFLPVIIPAGDLLEDAKQALEANKPSAAEQR